MALDFSTSKRTARFLDPFNGFQPVSREVQVRTDPLTGDRARVLPFRARNLEMRDHQKYIDRSLETRCPFCPGNLEEMTSRFLPEVVAEGRLSRGQATCFPNAFPYEAMNTVVSLCHAHYLRPGEFTPEIIADALLLSQESFSRLARGLSYASVNWNYMMPAGAGLVHPHFQLAAGRGPTRYQARLKTRARSYARRTGGALIDDYLAAEKEQGSRWLGGLGPAGWVTAFAPRAIYDVMALFSGGKGLMDLSEAEVRGLARGICLVLGYFDEKGLSGFNLALHCGLKASSGLPGMLRLVSRADIPPMGIDEINYFEKLHDEMLTFLPPEAVAGELGPVFRAAGAEN